MKTNLISNQNFGVSRVSYTFARELKEEACRRGRLFMTLDDAPAEVISAAHKCQDFKDSPLNGGETYVFTDNETHRVNFASKNELDGVSREILSKIKVLSEDVSKAIAEFFE